MDLVVSTPDGRDVACTSAYSMDAESGPDSDNDFELVVDGVDGLVGPGSFVAIEGTDVGGVVDGVDLSVRSGRSAATWRGRTWAGILAARVIVPPPGQDHAVAAGDAHEWLRGVVASLGLQGVFSVPASPAGVDMGGYKLERFCDAYGGISDALESVNHRLSISRADGTTTLSAVPADAFGDVDSDVIDFDLSRLWRPVNHLVCAGAGEMQQRLVVHLYADADGNIGEEQSLFGIDEVAEFYDYSNADEKMLKQDGREKLRDAQKQGAVKVTTHDGQVLHLGDEVRGVDRATGLSVTARGTNVICRADGGRVALSYEAGGARVGAVRGGRHAVAESTPLAMALQMPHTLDGVEFEV